MALQLGLVPFARHAWSVNLWQYLPAGLGWGLAAASLALCSGRARAAVARAAARLRARVPSASGAITGLELAALAGLLWLLRERGLFGDSGILLWETASGRSFYLKEMGSSFLLGTVVRGGLSAGLADPQVVGLVQALVCVAGALTVLWLYRAAGDLAPGRAGAVLGLLLCGGLLRVLAGHVEVYAFLLAAFAAYLHRALAFLRGRGSWIAACLALGIAVWMHLAALLLVPSLLALRGLAKPSPAPRAFASGLVLVVLPSAIFLVCQLGPGLDAGVIESVRSELSGMFGGGGASHRLWVRGFGAPPTGGTDYAFLGSGHLKYLVNAGYLLAPAALPALLGLLLWRPRSLLTTPVARFLWVAGLPLAVYSLVLRPVWGPFDWDLFALPALVLSCLALHGLSLATGDATWRELSVWLAGFSLLFVGLPFLAMGVDTAREAGPFAQEFRVEAIEPGTAEHARLAPWL